MKKEIQVNKPSDIYELEEVQEIKNAIQEHLLLIGLDRKNNILNISLIGIGNGGNIKIDTKYIVRTALITGCDSVILVHNHPANSLVPSKEDKYLTNYTKKVLEAFNIQLMDHLKNPIIGFEYRAIHMYFRIKLNDVEFDIPMEIQIKTYEMHHAWEAIHDTIYKNPNINLKDGCILLPMLFKIFEINAKVCKNQLNGCNVKIDFSAINSIIEYNNNLLKKHYLEIEKSCYNFARSIYLDSNRDFVLSDNKLLEIFNKKKNESNLKGNSQLHICNNSNLEYATFYLATHKLEDEL